MPRNIRSLAALPLCALWGALPLAAQTAPAPASAPTLAKAAAMPAAPVAFASADFDVLDASDRAFEPRPAEQLNGPWGRPADAFGTKPGEGRRTLRRFTRNLGRNVVGVVARENLTPFVAGAAASGVSALFDARTRRYFSAQPRWAALGRAGEKAGEPRNTAVFTVALFTAGRVAREPRFRAATYDLAQAFIVNAAWTGALKYGVRRERPDGSDRRSFPSGHTSNAFAWAAIADRHYGHKLGLPTYVAAGLIGVSRIEKNVHNLSDVLAGATLGYIVGRSVTRADGEATHPTRRLALTPTTGPGGHGVGLAVAGVF